MKKIKSTNKIIFGDNLKMLANIADNSVDLIYIDPPFNTGIKQKRTTIKTIASDGGDRIGFGGKSYKTSRLTSNEYSDSFKDYIGFLQPRLEQARRILKTTGCLFFHVDYREVHYCKIMLDKIFGRNSFINEIIWAYDYGARSKSKWPCKHDNILWYAVDPENYVFNFDQIDRIPYMAPDLVGAEKTKRGKTPTDVWWNTIVPTNSKEKTGYPTQKPLAILCRIIEIHSNPGDLVLDFFAGSGTTGFAALKLDRRFILIDNNPAAIKIMKKRFATHSVNFCSKTSD